MFQFSLHDLLIAVAAVSLGTAALALMVLYCRAAQRALWSGYLLMDGIYIFLLAISTHGFYRSLSRDNPLTTKVMFGEPRYLDVDRFLGIGIGAIGAYPVFCTRGKARATQL